MGGLKKYVHQRILKNNFFILTNTNMWQIFKKNDIFLGIKKFESGSGSAGTGQEIGASKHPPPTPPSFLG